MKADATNLIITTLYRLVGMTEDPRARLDVRGVRSRDSEAANSATSFFSPSTNISHVAQTLSEYTGGPVSVDLAFDLVLNEFVEQARVATGASGAAVALYRDGELTCRATTGENAPDLGVKVDSTSGLAGACVNTGEVQQCNDTETDPRVNAAACLQLGARSMLIAPLIDGQTTIGIIQVFSAWPNAFGKREISALHVLAARIAESSREAQSGIAAHPTDAPMSTPQESLEEKADAVCTEPAEEDFLFENREQRGTDVWGAVLVVLVIAASVALGLVIGWHHARQGVSPMGAGVSMNAPAARAASQAAPPESGTEPVNESASSGEAAGSVVSPAQVSIANSVPSGGLVVTQNGKVVYRSLPAAGVRPSRSPTERSVVHRVEPEYPEEARMRHIQGAVVLDVEVLGSGAVGNVSVVSGDPVLAQSAVAAVKQWRYQPAMVNGQGIDNEARITVKFTLPPS